MQSTRKQLEHTQRTLAEEKTAHGKTSEALSHKTLESTQLAQQVLDLQERPMDRKMRADLHQRRSRLARRSGSTGAVEFFNVLTSEELLQATEALRPEHRERLYAPTVTLSMFMRQTLEADGSCQWHLATTDRRNDYHDPIMH